MKKLKGFVFVVALISGCSSDLGMVREITDYENHCTSETVEQRSNFILQCIENANPKSDEEPEDWILKCKDMAVSTFCPVRKVIRTQECTRTAEFGNCSWYSARTLSQKYIDG